MTALVIAIFIASLMGSLHCAGMCGAFLAFAVGTDPGDNAHPLRQKAALQAAYHAGRLITYVMFGAIAGALGAALDLGGNLVGLQRAAAILAGAMMVGFGIIAVLRIRGVNLPRAPVPTVMRALLTRGHRAAFSLPPLRRALFIGLLTTLLPCGWLYAFVITAAGTGDPAVGVLAMAVFWLGTLPVMITLGAGLQTLTGALRKHLPLATSLAVVAVGLFTVFGRLTMPEVHAAHIAPLDTAGAAEHVRSLDAAEMPCCSGD